MAYKRYDYQKLTTFTLVLPFLNFQDDLKIDFKSVNEQFHMEKVILHSIIFDIITINFQANP